MKIMAKTKSTKVQTKSTKVQTSTKKGDKDYSLVTIKMIVKANNSTAEYLKNNGKDYHFWTTEEWTNFRDHAASQRVRLLLDKFGECFENEILTEYFEWKKTHISMRETEYQNKIKELEEKLAQYESKKSQAKADAKTAKTAAKAAKEETKESE